MWPFPHKKIHSEEDPEQFRERVKALESDIKLLRMEWTEIYDKIIHALDRERKRRAKLVEGSLEDSSVAGGNNTQIDWSDPVKIMEEARKRGF